MSRDTFQPLLLPVPPMLEAALGYPGTARYVAFYWLPGGDELMWDDGWSSADGSCMASVRQIRIGSKHGMISPSTT